MFCCSDKESKPEPPKSSSSFLTSLSDLPKLGSQASLGDLPPLTSNPRTSPVKLAALKKVPSIEKPPAQPKSKSGMYIVDQLQFFCFRPFQLQSCRQLNLKISRGNKKQKRFCSSQKTVSFTNMPKFLYFFFCK